MSPFAKVAGAAWLALAAAAAALRAGWLGMGALERVHLCLFRLVTGIPCPGCGMGHSLLAAFQGKWAESIAAHPLGLPFLAAWTSWLLWQAAGARQPVRLGRGVQVAALFAVLSAWALRFI